ncbi:MAG: phosphopentomutase [Gemmatimonadota bacterium]|nr:MAG: phosphopentomutase [Gemmatimonadota bacterium]
MKRRAGRIALVVLDGVGIGAAPDQAAYGDAGSDTLGNVARAVGGLRLPNLEALGLGCCRSLTGMRCERPAAAHGVALPRARGKDSTTGHWELCGLPLDEPFPTYPRGFPHSVIAAFVQATGRDVLGNRPASGTAIIDEFGPEQLARGDWIVYTSADSVFQIAAHEEAIPLEELYAACRTARDEILVGEHAVSRVIARPFVGEPGSFRRTANRRDFSLAPPGETLLDRLARAGVPRVGVGKVDDLFAARGIESTHTPTNAEAYALIADALQSLDRGLVFANVIEFDQSWGHRNDPEGFYRGLEELDRSLPELLAPLREDDVMIFTADHGNDPTTPSTDHSREAVPVLVAGPRVEPVALGERETFADLGATVAEYFSVEVDAGSSFLGQVAPWATG